MAHVLAPVEREHARPDHPLGGEARIVDGEANRIAEYRRNKIAVRDHPPAKVRDPRDGFVLTKNGEGFVE